MKSYRISTKNGSTMSTIKSGYPIEVSEGLVLVKIYKIRNKVYRQTLKIDSVITKPRFANKVSCFTNGKFYQIMVADLDEANSHAAQKAHDISKGNLNALPFDTHNVQIFRTAGRCQGIRSSLARTTKTGPATRGQAAVGIWFSVAGRNNLLGAETTGTDFLTSREQGIRHTRSQLAAG